jgi:hypothetical protein
LSAGSLSRQALWTETDGATLVAEDGGVKIVE